MISNDRASGLNLRTGPGMNFSVQQFIPNGTSAVITGGPRASHSYEWWSVTVAGSSGWAAGFGLRRAPRGPAPTAPGLAPQPNPGDPARLRPDFSHAQAEWWEYAIDFVTLAAIAVDFVIAKGQGRPVLMTVSQSAHIAAQQAARDAARIAGRSGRARETVLRDALRAAEDAARYVISDAGRPLSPSGSNYAELFRKAVPWMPSHFQVHHSLPQLYEPIMRAAGINIHELRFLRGMDPTIHKAITTEWDQWGRVVGRIPTAGEIITFAARIDSKYPGELLMSPVLMPGPSVVPACFPSARSAAADVSVRGALRGASAEGTCPGTPEPTTPPQRALPAPAPRGGASDPQSPEPPYGPSFAGQTVSWQGNSFRSDDGKNWIFQGSDADRAAAAPANPRGFRVVAPDHGASFTAESIPQFSWEPTLDERGGAVQFELKINDLVSPNRRSNAGASREYVSPRLTQTFFTPPVVYFRAGFEYEWSVEAISHTNSRRVAEGSFARLTIAALSATALPLPSPSTSSGPVNIASPSPESTVAPASTLPNASPSATPTPTPTASPTATPSPDPVGCEAGTVALWSLTEGMGTSVNDECGGIGAAIQGGSWTAGPFGPAAYFSGGTVMTTANSGSFDVSRLTIEAFVRFERAGAVHILHRSRARDTEDQYRLVIRDACNLEFGIDGYVPEQMRGGPSPQIGRCPLSIGRWYHVAATYDGDRMRTYVNGTLVGESDSQPNLIPLGTGPVIIGENSVGHDRLVGAIQFVRISNVSRTTFPPSP